MFVDASGLAITSLGMDTPEWGPNMIPLHPRTMEKIASELFIPESLVEFMESIRPREDGRYILLHAIGAGEYWGANKNGDYFPEWSLKGLDLPDDVKVYVRDRGLPVPHEYGYKTFEAYGWPYRHHNNSDPIHTIGERVCRSAYNDRMHRIELIIFVRKDLAPDLVARIDAGVQIPWSMGSKLPFDVCSVCMNPAKTRQQYCVHLKDMLNRILPDGTKVFSYNYFPRFFDISEVTVPADRSAYSLKKVAEFLESGQASPIWVPGMDYVSIGPTPDEFRMVVDSEMEKIAERPGWTSEERAHFDEMIEFLSNGGDKEADIDKEVPAQEPGKNLGSEPVNKDLWQFIYDLARKDREKVQEMPSSMRDDLSDHPIDRVLQALTAAGVQMTPGESEDVIGDRDLPDGLDTSCPDSTLLKRISDIVPGRSMFEPRFSVRVIQISRVGDNEPDLPKPLVKKANGVYDQYVKWLRSIELEKLAELVAHPPVQLLLNPDVLKDKMFEFEEEKVGCSLEEEFLPFVAGAALED